MRKQNPALCAGVVLQGLAFLTLSAMRQVVAPYYARPRRTPPRTGTTLFVAGLNFITTERVRSLNGLSKESTGVRPASSNIFRA